MQIKVDLSGGDIQDDARFLHDAFKSLTLLSEEAGSANGASQLADVSAILTVLCAVQHGMVEDEPDD